MCPPQRRVETYRDAQKRIPNHDLHTLRPRLPNRIIPIVEKAPNALRPIVTPKSRTLIKQLQHINHPANVLRHPSEGVDGARDVRGCYSEAWVVGALARVVVAVLASRGAMQVKDGVDGVGFGPVEGLEDVWPGAGDVWRWGGAKRRV